MANQNLENENEINGKEFTNNEPTNYSILDQPINEKKYSRPNIKVEQDLLNKDIPEAEFVPPPIDFGEPTVNKEPKKEKPNPIMPDMGDLSKKDKTMASDSLADVVLDVYSLMHELVNKNVLMVSEKKLMKMSKSGEIDLNTEIQYDINQTMKAGEFFQEYNKQAENALTVSPEFREEAKPLLSEIMQKKGLGLTAEGKLGFLFMKDIIIKGVMVASFKSQLNQILVAIKEQTANNSKAIPTPQNNTEQREQPDIVRPAEKADNLFQEPIETKTGVKGDGESPNTIIIPDMPEKKKRGRKKKSEQIIKLD